MPTPRKQPSAPRAGALCKGGNWPGCGPQPRTGGEAPPLRRFLCTLAAPRLDYRFTRCPERTRSKVRATLSGFDISNPR